MLEKEHGHIQGNEFGSLWEDVGSKTGHIRLDISTSEWVSYDNLNIYRYKNTITGSLRDTRPQICLGGILADVSAIGYSLRSLANFRKEMGLGKTLATLALIASSIESSVQMESRHIAAKGHGNGTTLVVVPLSSIASTHLMI